MRTIRRCVLALALVSVMAWAGNGSGIVKNDGVMGQGGGAAVMGSGGGVIHALLVAWGILF